MPERVPKLEWCLYMVSVKCDTIHDASAVVSYVNIPRQILDDQTFCHILEQHLMCEIHGDILCGYKNKNMARNVCCKVSQNEGPLVMNLTSGSDAEHGSS